MRRTSVRIGLGAVAVMAGFTLTACGSDDSSASSTPSFTSSTTAAPNSESPADTTSAAPTSPGAAATAPPTDNQPAPSGFPGPTGAPAADARGDRFLTELKAKGVTYAGNGSIAIATANYICAARADGVADDQISTFVTANVGSEASVSGTEITAEQAGATAQTYIDVAASSYCS